MPRRFALWAPVVVWAGVIFTLSSIPSLSTGLGAWDEVLRKGAHLTEYAILGALLLRALGGVAPAFLLGVAYAVTDEIHQHFVRGRHASPFDVAFDATGVALGLLVALSVQSHRARTKELRRPAAGRDPRAPRRTPGRAADAEPPA
jgi:VanZ family protein